MPSVNLTPRLARESKSGAKDTLGWRDGVERSSPRARDILAGGNPAEDIRMEKQTPTFREFTDEYLRRCDPHWKPSGRKTVRIYLKARILPAFGKMPIDLMEFYLSVAASLKLFPGRLHRSQRWYFRDR